MITLKEAKEWLRIFEDDEDNLIDSLIKSSVAIIKSATGVSIGYINQCNDEEIKFLYSMIQKILITDLYYEKDKENKALLSLYIQLEATYLRMKNNES
ncbi:head-tail connector protein [Clostridium perfringens]|uniref:Phage gp6-like head-tail connector protein n=2 Tax=Clostridium perfringens TaxID=1502 RepID=A0AAP7BUZ4_CLOPF|nr:head-tail connector protein [Clostridium perfringens]EDT22816.1 conserved hypothetical protein [Clostridium perfringens B str. ATCC 3626]NGU29496.1 phage gp6-like head-tail connector protein [Clostridium perfringens]WEV04486.1 head-tail connector protein [Clostridium perfringens B]